MSLCFVLILCANSRNYGGYSISLKASTFLQPRSVCAMEDQLRECEIEITFKRIVGGKRDVEEKEGSSQRRHCTNKSGGAWAR